MAGSNTAHTPAQKRKAVTAPCDLATNQLRHVVLDDLQETVYQAEWQWFQQAILPASHHSFDMKEIMKTLTNKGVLTSVHNQARWSAFANCPPAVDPDDEDTVFAVLQDIISAIRGSSNIRVKRETNFLCKPTTVPSSSTRDNKSKPDGYFVVNDDSVDKSAPRWIDIAVPAEFKKKNTDESRNQNATQILWSLTHIMREDPRRRFVIGFTIEDCRMRLWVATRSDDIEKVIDFVLRISFARRDELGFDDTIVRLPTLDSCGGPQYEILVNKKWYRTQRLISNIGAEALRGRGTRVWEVRELDRRGGKEIGPRLVLKDSWVDADRDREATILENIRKSATTDVQREAFDTYLLHAKDSWDVRTAGNKVDSTRKVICRRPLPPAMRAMAVKKYPDEDKTVDVTLPPQGAIAGTSSEGPGPVMFAAKVHHRILFGDVGKTIMEAGTLGAAFRVLANIITILKVLHQCGWVHRDVSAGNVLIINNVGKLVDVEYAKHESDDRSHEVRTGTAYFMAVEVEQHRYRFGKRNGPRANKDHTSSDAQEESEDSDAETARELRLVREQQLVPDSEWPPDKKKYTLPVPDALPVLHVMPFRHNPLHDLESVLWLALYIVLCSTIEKWNADLPDEEWANYSLARSRLAAKLFNDSVFRSEVIGVGNAFCSSLAKLHPAIQAICDKLDEYIMELVGLYRSAEQRQLQAAIEAASASSATPVPEAIPYTVAHKAKFYKKATEIFSSIWNEQLIRAQEKEHIVFKPRTTLLSEQQREMITMLETAGQPTTMATVAEEEDTDSEPPRKNRKLKHPRPEEVAAASRRGKMRQDPRQNRITVSSSAALGVEHAE
ncbi:uncharacterized protein PHACADRAFT_132197 [Phanerochaete carnosa HHB-10118-sp]|uniref:Fungal-type protein kinase domain-containing protein n=1 Tax=Phanerochaete carnosa (strain HHB-10118-sp) TaxID=650164 RepID=K5WF32_PHACS|nr:uncharacterized protein PHACADRAFT_132197 [Phanerochaete carnosa HHB-10118-sp]EKM48777.1 hypothetical protein PHACADRAFT_132197 [Phanerochaete carnosa HHB-10118-sp]